MTVKWAFRVKSPWQEQFAEVGLSTRASGYVVVRAGALTKDGGRATTSARIPLEAARALRAALSRAIRELEADELDTLISPVTK
jgi:hypothetical protein